MFQADAGAILRNVVRPSSHARRNTCERGVGALQSQSLKTQRCKPWPRSCKAGLWVWP
jgi:hypothetical protein